MAIGNNRNRPELRRKPRRQFHYNASVLLERGGSPCPYEIADISETGARLVLEGDFDLPDRFVLLLTRTGEARRSCRLVWRDGLTVGVQFPNVET
jgi:hypothetical protein